MESLSSYDQLDESAQIERAIIAGFVLEQCRTEMDPLQNADTNTNNINEISVHNASMDCGLLQEYWLSQLRSIELETVIKERTVFEEIDLFDTDVCHGNNLSASLFNHFSTYFCQLPKTTFEFKHIDIPAERKHLLEKAIQIAKEHFPDIHEINSYNEVDPETGEAWSVLEIDVKDKIEIILDQLDNYTDEWVKKIPWPERDAIRLSYNIL